MIKNILKLGVVILAIYGGISIFNNTMNGANNLRNITNHYNQSELIECHLIEKIIHNYLKGIYNGKT
jgi:hypothetical protein